MKKWIKNNPGKALIAFACLLPTGGMFGAVGFVRMAEGLNVAEYAKGITQPLNPVPPLALFLIGITMLAFAFIINFHSLSSNAQNKPHLQERA